MKISNASVRARLMLGFSILLATTAFIGLLGVFELRGAHQAVDKMTGRHWAATRQAITVRANTLGLIAKSAEYLIAEDDRSRLSERIAEHSAVVASGLAKLAVLEAGDPQALALLEQTRETQGLLATSLEEVLRLAGNPQTLPEARKFFRHDTGGLVDAFLKKIQGVLDFHEAHFNRTTAAIAVDYTHASRLIYGALACALVLGAWLAIFLSRGIVLPLKRAVGVAEAIRAGKLDNVIECDSRDESGQLLLALNDMQDALRARDERDADSRGQIAAIGKAQAVIEFAPDGTILEANANFLQALDYSSEEIRGRHHRMFVDEAFAASAEYARFWQKLARGEFDTGEYKRIGKAGKEVWIQASYNPITDASGKVVKVVKFASDITATKLRNADFEGQMAAIGKAQAVIEFDLEGMVRSANENFLKTLGYALEEIRGRHHSLFVDPAESAAPAYRAFWQKLARGELDAGQYKRLGKGGREVWIQASYNPIFDASGRPIKIVKYATDVTAQVLLSRQLQAAVTETQSAVSCASEGDLTQRVPMQGKTGELETLCRGVNALLDSMSDLVARVKAATGEVTVGAEEISKGNLNLSQRTEEQASSLEETASSMEQMTSTVKQTADNAGQANQLAMAARQQAEKGGSVVGTAVHAMRDINEASRKIVDIIAVIDGIAFQTNLLALNAAVEAARAGEQGRGFAVVASEVRSLAGRSATAAKEIKSLIVDSVAKVEEGSKLVDESGRVLEDIVQSVKKVTDIVAEIAAASREQSSGIEQVNKAVMQMDTTTQQNAALVEEAAAASQAIVEQAQSLSSMVSRYRLNEVEARPKAPVAKIGERRPREIGGRYRA